MSKIEIEKLKKSNKVAIDRQRKVVRRKAQKAARKARRG
jgi:hypothetical protein